MRQGFDFVFQNKFLFERESDIIACKDSLFYEYEFKIGRADFRKDFKKNRHQIGKPHYFNYVVSDLDIINNEYLNYAGIYVHKFQSNGDSMFKEVKKAELIRTDEISKYELYSLLRKIYNGK